MGESGPAVVPSIAGFADLVEIGRGGFSVVYAATEVAFGRRVAVKVVEATGEDARRFQREALALGALSDIPHVVQAFSIVSTDDGRPVLVMPLLAQSLASFVRAEGAVESRRALRWASQLATALDEAHRRGVVHRDVKPENVLISEKDDVFLADFGIASIPDGDPATTTSFAISPAHAPPERFTGGPEQPVAGDLYSFASTVYTALSGRVPFGTTADGGVLGLSSRVALDPVPPVDGVPETVNGVLQWGLAKDPAARPASASALVDALLVAFRSGVSEIPARPGVVDDVDQTVQRDRLPLGEGVPPVAPAPRSPVVPAPVVPAPPAPPPVAAPPVPAPPPVAAPMPPAPPAPQPVPTVASMSAPSEVANRRPSKRGWVVAAVVVVAIVGLVVGGLAVWGGGSSAPSASRASSSSARPASWVTAEVAGLAKEHGSVDGVGADARFGSLQQMAAAPDGSLYVADYGVATIRRIDPSGRVTLYAGVPNAPGYVDGPADAARFDQPTGVAVAADGTVFVADGGNHAIRSISTGGVVSTLAGRPDVPGTEEPGERVFAFPYALAWDPDGRLLVTDTEADTVLAVTRRGEVTTLAGAAGVAGSVDGRGSQARFDKPTGIAVDGSGRILVADSSNHTIRRIGRDGSVSTVAGRAGSAGMVDGAASSSRLWFPDQLAWSDRYGLFVSDSGNHRVRLLTSAGSVITVAGAGGAVEGPRAGPLTAMLSAPAGLAEVPGRGLYVADSDLAVVRRLRRRS